MHAHELNLRDLFGPGGLISQRLNGYEFRPQQLQMAEAVADALSSGAHLVVEAGVRDPDRQWPRRNETWSSPSSSWKSKGPPTGTLILSGQGRSDETLERFLAAAGGPSARVIVIPTADTKALGVSMLQMEE